MNKKLRTILIIFFSILFLIGTPFAILKSYGYRIDLENRKFVKTGGLSIKTHPKQCNVYLNEKLTKKTNFLFGDAFIKDLLPDEYNVRIEKTGYITWEKTFDVKEELVTKIEHVLLFPENLNLTNISSEVKDYFFSPDQKKIIFIKIEDENWFLEHLDLEKNNPTIILQNSHLNKTDEFLGLKWSHDSESIILKTKDKKLKEINFSIITDFESDKAQVISLEQLTKVNKADFNPGHSKEVFFIEGRKLNKINFLDQEDSETILENFLTYHLANEYIFWLDENGFIYKSDFSGKRLENTNNVPLQLKKGSEYEIETFDENIFIKEGSNLYKFNQESRGFVEFSSNVNILKVSPDSRKLCIASNNEIHILFLSEILEQPEKEKGQKIFLTRFSEKIENLSWINDHYLIFNTGDKIRTVEIDSRNGINVVILGELESPKLFWNNVFKKIYILSEENLYSSIEIL